LNFSKPEEISKQAGKQDALLVYVNTYGLLKTKAGLSQDPKGNTFTIALPQQYIAPLGYTGKYQPGGGSPIMLILATVFAFLINLGGDELLMSVVSM
jgi:hypothetical protein